MGDFNLCLLKSELSSLSHDFLLSLQSCYLIPTIDKPTRVHGNSASLIDNVLVNNPDHVTVSDILITDVSDHFSQFFIFKSTREKISPPKFKVRDFSHFNKNSFVDDVNLIQLIGIQYLKKETMTLIRLFPLSIANTIK